MSARKQRTARPKVSQCRMVSVEADALSRQLQEELGCSANRLAELAIFALAEAQKHKRTPISEKAPRAAAQPEAA
jgi:hypothetical protein